MRHGVAGFKLKRPVDSRNALLRNLVTSVIEQERIITTVPKAKAAKPLVEKMTARVSETHGASSTMRTLRAFPVTIGFLADRWRGGCAPW